MKTLVDTILSLESEADSRLAAARTEAKQIEDNAKAEVEKVKKQIANETDQRVALFREKAEQEFQKAASQIEEEHKIALQKIEQVPADKVASLADYVVQCFQDW